MPDDIAAPGARIAEESVAPVPGVETRFWPAFQISDAGSFDGAGSVRLLVGSVGSGIVFVPIWMLP